MKCHNNKLFNFCRFCTFIINIPLHTTVQQSKKATKCYSKPLLKSTELNKTYFWAFKHGV